MPHQPIRSPESEHSTRRVRSIESKATDNKRQRRERSCSGPIGADQLSTDQGQERSIPTWQLAWDSRPQPAGPQASGAPHSAAPIPRDGLSR